MSQPQMWSELLVTLIQSKSFTVTSFPVIIVIRIPCHDFHEKGFLNEKDKASYICVLFTLDCRYYTTSQLNEKSDVFGFGVVILEIITGKPALIRGEGGEGNVIHIYNWVNMLLSRGDIRSIIDPKMKDFNINSAWKAVDVAMSCVSTKSKDRPSMSQVVVDLKECLAMESARNKPPRQAETGVAESSTLFGPSAR